MVFVESEGITDVGKKRKGNEDSLFLDDELGVYVVADGMGGHQAGEVASGLLVKTLGDYMKRFKNDKNIEESEEIDKSLSKEANRLITGVHLANQAIYEESLKQSSYQGMGSTVAAIYLANDTIIAINVGDSPIYLIRNNSIENLYVPHTVYEEQKAFDPGNRTFGKKYSHMLTRAMGIEDMVEPDTFEIECLKNDLLVLASDGLTDKVSPDEVLNVVSTRTPGESCRTLVNMANERGGDDNITVIVLKVISVGPQRCGFWKWISDIFRW